jgi:hypothetical protein
MLRRCGPHLSGMIQLWYLRDPLIRSWRLIPEGFHHFLFVDATPSNFYRPLQRLAYTLEYWTFAFRPGPYHFTNILLHAATLRWRPSFSPSRCSGSIGIVDATKCDHRGCCLAGVGAPSAPFRSRGLRRRPCRCTGRSVWFRRHYILLIRALSLERGVPWKFYTAQRRSVTRQRAE